MGLSYAKRNHVDIFRHLTAMHECDRETDQGTVTSIPMGEISFRDLA